MTGVALAYDIRGIARLRQRMAGLQIFDTDDLLEAVGVEIESQVRRRIDDEKTDPEGKAWPEWSPDYALTRHSGHSKLEGSGDLLDSIQHVVAGKSVEVGSNLVYFAMQNFGGKKSDFPNLWGDIPARTVLGLSDENAQDIEAIVDDFIARMVQ